MNLDSKFMASDYVPLNLASSYEDYERNGSDISVVGSLQKHCSQWKNMGAPLFVLEIIKHGYTIPFKSIPKAKHLRSNYFSRSRPTFVRHSIDELVQKGAVVELKQKPRVVNPLTVSSKNGKLRLVLDLRHVNPHVFKQPCKIEGPETLAKYLPGSSHLFGFDLKAGYHHVDIPAHQSFLGFSFPDHTGRVRYFQFRVMPFGLGPPGFVFTKLLRALIKIWRTNSIRIVAFFDDGICAVYSYEEGLSHAAIVKADLLRC